MISEDRFYCVPDEFVAKKKKGKGKNRKRGGGGGKRKTSISKWVGEIQRLKRRIRRSRKINQLLKAIYIKYHLKKGGPQPKAMQEAAKTFQGGKFMPFYQRLVA